MTSRLLNPCQVQRIFTRSVIQHNKNKIYKEVGNGKKFDAVTYYPRDKDFKEAEVPNPPKLFRVQRLKTLKGCPFWEKRILRDLGLVYNTGQDVAIVKNIPENNARLWKVKHLVSVEPIIFPFGEPTEADINYTFLKHNGECLVTKSIDIDPKRIEATDSFLKDPERLDKDTLKRDALLQWVRCY